MDKEYIVSNICDHFVFQDDLNEARNMCIDFVTDYYKKYKMKSGSLNYIICAINYLWLFCENEGFN